MDPKLYQEHRELEDQHWWFVGRRAFIHKLIGRCFSKNSSKLTFCEIGSGTGGNLPMLASFANVDSIEMNDVAREEIIIKKIQGVSRVMAGALPDQLPDIGHYDAVFALDVIEHVEDDSGSLEKIYEHVKPSGFFITTVPAYPWLWSDHDVVNHHKRRYTRTQFVNRIRAAGFEIEYSSYFNSLMFPLAAVSRVIDRLTTTSTEATDSSLKLPPRWVNTLLSIIFKIESLWAGKLNIPFGVSIAVIAKKPE